MNVHMWALITFTILAQLSVGSFVVLGILHTYVARKVGPEQADQLGDRALLGIGVALVLGLVASLFHLGNPMSAYRAVMNIDTSWLSREILFGVLFAVVGGVFALLQWRKIGSIMLRSAVAWLAAALGLALIYCMSQVYMLETQPAWNTWVTPVLFFTTTLLLGCLAIGASFMFSYFRIIRAEGSCSNELCELLRTSMRWIAVAVVVLIGVELILTPFWAVRVASLAGGTALLYENWFLFAARLVLGFIGAGVLGLFLYQKAAVPGKEKTLAIIAYSAFGFVLIAEILNRLLFYVTQIQVGV